MEINDIKVLATYPEYVSIESFVEDNEDGEFTRENLQVLNYRLQVPIASIKKELERYGLKLRLETRQNKGRGFNSNDHDRWNGPGSWNG